MTKNIEDLRQWYVEHGMYPLFVKEYVCKECKYQATCTGLANEVRVSCKSFAPKSGEEFDQSSKWGEMSYWRY